MTKDEEMRAKAQAMKEWSDRMRGRSLTDKERLENLRRAFVEENIPIPPFMRP